MSVTRLAVWLLFAAVGGAWLASAAGIARYSPPPRLPQRASTDVQIQSLAADVHAQTGRLRDRLAASPMPSARERNPFAFSPREQPTVRRTPRPTDVTSPLPPIEAPTEPMLSLIGVAELETPSGTVRTAMLAAGHDELIMARVGERILGRYDVRAIGMNTIELTDIQTDGVRRLALR